jgi:hypothetical protein
MRATELRAVDQLTRADIVQLGNDPRFFNVMGVECSPGGRDARCEVTLRSFDGLQGIMLVRSAHESVLIVPRPDPACC